jgi:excinuclease ABC subunit B
MGSDTALKSPLDFNAVSDPICDKLKVKVIAELEQEMRDASSKLEFERAAHLRDQIATLKSATPVMPPQKKVKYSGKKEKGKG